MEYWNVGNLWKGPIPEQFVRGLMTHSMTVQISRGQVNSVIPAKAGIQVHSLSEDEKPVFPRARE
jgi:hypothetical protein